MIFVTRSLKRVALPIGLLVIFFLLARTLSPSSKHDSTQSRWKSSNRKPHPAPASWPEDGVTDSGDAAAEQILSKITGAAASPAQQDERPIAAGAANVPQRYPVTSFIPLPSSQPSRIFKIQFEFEAEDPEAEILRQSRLAAVREAIEHSLNGYKNNAWLRDEVAPMTGGYRTTLGGWALTLIDSLDLMWIVGMHEEFERAVAAVGSINFDKPESLPLNVFEITIRYLGGLIGAYDVSEGKYPVLLAKATEVGEMLYAAFDTPNRMPVLRWRKLGVEVPLGQSLLAELGSMSLEFTRLSVLTGDGKFYDAVQRITNHFETHQNQTRIPGLWPSVINAREGGMGQGTTFSLAGASDSMYEYLVKEYLLLGGRVDQYEKLYLGAIEPIQQHLLFKPMVPSRDEILFSGTAKSWRPGTVDLDPQTSHLTCFAGGMLALGARVFRRTADIDIAKKLVGGCIWAYKAMPSGIMPEEFHVVPCQNSEEDSCTWDEEAWAKDMVARNSNDEMPGDKKLPWKERIEKKADRLRLPRGISAIASRQYLLRPEAIESIFVLYRITGDERLRDEAWTMFQAITDQTRTKIAFSSIDDVSTRNSRKLDRMESFWTAETLKYFFLLFSKPDVVSLDKYVLNTEGHPFIAGYNTEEEFATQLGGNGFR